MSIFGDAHCQILLADYIGVDAGGKANIIGGGFAIAGLTPQGFTSAQYVLALVDVPSRYRGEEFGLTLELHNETDGGLVQIPGPSGQPEPLRIAQLTKVEPPMAPGVYLPESVAARIQAVIAFPNGLPLLPGKNYAWKITIDGQTRPGWKAVFHVAGQPPQPVFGGPAGPANIPDLPQA